MNPNPNLPPEADEAGALRASTAREHQTSLRLAAEEFAGIESVRALLGASRAKALRAVIKAGLESIESRRADIERVRDILSK